MALVVDAHQPFNVSNSTRKERRVGRQLDRQQFELECCSNRNNGVDQQSAELVSGRLTMAGWPVFGRLYQTTGGRMLVLWPDKLYASPIGCATLRDLASVVTDAEALTFTLTSWRDSEVLPLTLQAPDVAAFREWTSILAGSERMANNGRQQRKSSSNVIRLPMLVEEEP